MAHDKRQELAYRASALDQQLKQLRLELENVMRVLVELERAKAAIANMEKGKEMMFQVSAGILAHAQLIDEKFLVPAGGGYFIAMGKEATLGKVEESINKTKDYYDRINAEVKKAEKDLIALMKEARGM